MEDTYVNKVDTVVNEISLEGLDGITLQGLWVRLSECVKIPLPFSEKIKTQYWNVVCNTKGLEMYELEEPRLDLVIYDRFKYIDAEFGVIYYEPDDVPEDIYPHCPIQDPANGIRGSSTTYHTRVNVTETARSKTVFEAEETWGNKLIIVASQEQREFALMGRPKIERIELSLMSYCLLEIIGRSRYHGEITQGKRSLQRLGETAKTLFYHRKSLLKHNLITKQMYHQKCGQHNYSGSLFHLTRYYVERKPKSLILTEQIVALLKTKPKYRMRYDDLPKDSAISANMKRLFILPEFQRFVKIDVKIPYRDMYPNAPQTEWKQKGTGREKHIRIFELIDPNVNVYEKWMHSEEKEEEEDSNLGNLNYDEMSFNVNSVLHAYAVISKYGPQGLSQLELGKEMGMTRLSSRAVCRTLLRRNAVVCVPSDFGRHRVTKFVCKQYMKATKMQFDEEKARVLSMLKNYRSKNVPANSDPMSSGVPGYQMKMEHMYRSDATITGMTDSALALFATPEIGENCNQTEQTQSNICQSIYPYDVQQDNDIIEIDDSSEEKEVDIRRVKKEYSRSAYNENETTPQIDIQTCESALITYRDKPPAVHKRIKEILNSTPINIEYPSKKLVKKYSTWFENLNANKYYKHDVGLGCSEYTTAFGCRVAALSNGKMIPLNLSGVTNSESIKNAILTSFPITPEQLMPHGKTRGRHGRSRSRAGDKDDRDLIIQSDKGSFFISSKTGVDFSNSDACSVESKDKDDNIISQQSGLSSGYATDEQSPNNSQVSLSSLSSQTGRSTDNDSQNASTSSLDKSDSSLTSPQKAKRPRLELEPSDQISSDQSLRESDSYSKYKAMLNSYITKLQAKHPISTGDSRYYFTKKDQNKENTTPSINMGPKLLFANCEVVIDLNSNRFMYRPKQFELKSSDHTDADEKLLDKFLAMCVDKDGNKIKPNISAINSDLISSLKKCCGVNLSSISLLFKGEDNDQSVITKSSDSESNEWKYLSESVSYKLKQILSEDIKVVTTSPSVKDLTNSKENSQDSTDQNMSDEQQQISFLQNTNLVRKSRDDIKTIKNLMKLHSIENALQEFDTYLNVNNNPPEVSNFLDITDVDYTLDRNLTDNFPLDFLVDLPSEHNAKNMLLGTASKKRLTGLEHDRGIKRKRLDAIRKDSDKLKRSCQNSSGESDMKRVKVEKKVRFASDEDMLRMNDSNLEPGNTSCDEIEVKWTIAEMVPGIKPCTTGLAEQLISEMRGTNPENSKVSFRILRRANIILETVETEKVIVELWKLKKLIQDVEHKEGYNIKIDKKSLIRLLLKLSRDGYIKFMKATLSHNSKVKHLFFTCDPNVDENHGIIQSALEQTKMKFFLTPKKSKREMMEMEEMYKPSLLDPSSPFDSDIFDEGREELRAVSTLDKVDYVYERSIAKAYGYSPKFIRMRIIHEMLFYLIYEEFEEPLTEIEEIEHFLDSQGVNTDDKLLEEMATVYHKKVGWKMFIPPIPRHKGWLVGWTLACDILLRLPLSIFMKCFNVPYLIEDLAYYLNHPVRQHFLVKNLPAKIRSGLMYDRKYIFSMHEILCKLCFIGLLQFGPQRLKEKDQVFIYLNRRTTLLNTVPSKPGYHETSQMEYEKNEYYFQTSLDLEHYWYELWSICVNTSLGGRTCVEGQYIILEHLQTKPAMVESLLPRTAEEAPLKDVGLVPGDKRGAAGFDSALFAHLKRNWNWASTTNFSQVTIDEFKSKDKSPRVDKSHEIVVRKHYLPSPKNVKKMKKQKKSEGPRKRFKIQQQIIRKILPRRIRHRKPFYDEKDKKSLQLMNKVRIGWTPLEDNVLLLCTVGSIFLCPNRHKQIISFGTIRDVLHKMVGYSICKTSRACQRRIAYIMKNSSTRRSVNTYLEEVFQSSHLKHSFGYYLERAQNGKVTTEDELNRIFIKLVSYLGKQFYSMITPPREGIAYKLPTSINEFKKRFLISLPMTKMKHNSQDPFNVPDIHFNVVKNIIHSSMCCAKDKCSWAYQLFKVYQNYPEALLRLVITNIKRNQMVSLKKTFVKSHRSSHYMPLTSSPYQLSISYVHQMQTKYRYDIYNQAFDLIADISMWLCEVRGTDIDALEVSRPVNGLVACMMELMSTQSLDFVFEIPEQVIVLDPRIESNDSYSRLVKRYYEILKDPSSVRERNNLDVDEDEENYPNVPDELIKVDVNPTASRSTSRIAFYMMRAEMCEGIDEQVSQHIHDYFVVNACKVFINLPEANSYFETWGNAKICTKLMPLRPEICNDLIRKIKCDATVPDDYFSEDELREYLQSKSVEKYDVRLTILLSNFILDKGYLGITIKELWDVFPRPYKGKLGMRAIIEILLELRIIIRVGVNKVRFVHNEHKKPWVVKSYKILRLEREKICPKKLGKAELTGKNPRLKKHFSLKELKKSKESLDLGSQQMIKVLVTPWIRIDGSLNRRVLDKWLATILSTCLYNPGITLFRISHQFQYMNPFDVTTLIEFLVVLGCIKMTKCKRAKCILWSKVPDIKLVPASGFENPHSIFLEPNPDAIMKLSLFIGEKAYVIDFLA